MRLACAYRDDQIQRLPVEAATQLCGDWELVHSGVEPHQRYRHISHKKALPPKAHLYHWQFEIP